MKAAILKEGKLDIKDVPTPEPAGEHALIKMVSAGVCHSDLHLVKQDWPRYKSPYPMPLGHEGIGIVEKLGPGADKFVQEGDRVILGMGGTGGGYWCGACEFCLSGRPRLCRQAKGISGCYAEYISVYVKSLVKLPDNVPNTEVPLACGGLTAYGAVKKLNTFSVMPGKPVAIIGAAGGLGHYAVQIAKSFGYKVIGVDVGPEKIDFIKQVGADYAVDAADAVKFAKENFGGASASIVFSPKIAGFELGLKMLKRGSLFVSVGMPAASEGDICISPLELLRIDPTIISSAVGTVQDMREVVDLAADGKIKTHVTRTGKLSELSNIFDEMAAGKISGRAILDNMAS